MKLKDVMIAVFIGIVLSFAIVALTAPQPVIKQPTIIEPVQPESVQPTASPTPDVFWGEGKTLAEITQTQFGLIQVMFPILALAGIAFALQIIIGGRF